MDAMTLIGWLIGFMYFWVQLMRKLEPNQRRPWRLIFWISTGAALFWPIVLMIAVADYLRILCGKRKQ